VLGYRAQVTLLAEPPASPSATPGPVATGPTIELSGLALGAAPLPEPRGPISEWLLDRLVRPVHELSSMPTAFDDPVTGDDSALALYLCYELHYLGLPGVDEDWEWEPSLLRERQRLERRLEDRLVELAGPVPLGLSPAAAAAALRELASDDGAPSLSARVASRGTLAELRELAVHRSCYQLKEADPHTWGIPRLRGRAKAALVDIQMGEYGYGRPADVHATLFAECMRALGLDDRYGAYLDVVPGVTLSTCNLISLYGLHRRWRGALLGHLALFEMCSVGPMGRYAQALRRLGFGPDATRFYDEHVLADERHQVVALDEMVAALLADERELGGEVVHGARALAAVEAAFARHVIDRWDAGTTSLRTV
jgi:hypothetical protein